MTDMFDVVIVGYGPTGLVLASSLGQAGHRVAVVDRWPTLYGLPRLSHIDDETARIIQATGIVEEALSDSAPIASYRFLNAAGETLAVLGGGGHDGPCGYPADISIFQPDIEDAIDRRVASCGSVDRLLGWEAIALNQDASGVRLSIRPAESDEAPRELRTRYLVACDGARSFVRETVGITRTDFGFNERWLNIDTAILRPLPERFAESVQICDPARGHMHLPIGYKRLRFELAVLSDEDVDEFLTSEFAWEWLRKQHDLGPEDVSIIRQIVYTFEARSADRWREGAVLLAGDACHTMPPYLGQGACSGMRDGYTLGWMLDLVLRGLAPETLLNSYEIERKPHVTVITHMAIGLGKLANEHDPERARLRDEALRTHPPQKPDFPIRRAGVLDPNGSALSGTIWPQGIVELNGRRGRFDDVVARGFILLSRNTLVGPEDDRALAAFRRIGGQHITLADFTDVNGAYARFFEGNGLEAIITRPDFVIFGTAPDGGNVRDLIGSLLDTIGPEQQVLMHQGAG